MYVNNSSVEGQGERPLHSPVRIVVGISQASLRVNHSAPDFVPPRRGVADCAVSPRNMDGPSKPTSNHSTNGLPVAARNTGSQGSDSSRLGIAPHDKRQSIIANPPPTAPSSSSNAFFHKPRSDPVNVKRSGFSLFNKFKDEDDEREQLKRFKAENKQLRAELKELQIKSNLIGAENERFKNTMVGDRKINHQLQPDAHYSSALERISVGLTDWTVTHYRGKNTRPYTPEMVDEIRSGLRKLSDANNLIPPSLLWTEVDLQTALQDSKFRIAFVLHVIGLHLHEKVFSPFAYEIEDFGLGYWLKRISDEVARSGMQSSFSTSLLTCFEKIRIFITNGIGAERSFEQFRTCLTGRPFKPALSDVSGAFFDKSIHETIQMMLSSTNSRIT